MTRTLYEFGSALYRNRADMTKAIAEEWITSQGSNSAKFVAETLCRMSDNDMAAECIEGWGLNMADDCGDGDETHMSFNDYDATDLATEFREMRQPTGESK